jgi:hypothetical protein
MKRKVRAQQALQIRYDFLLEIENVNCKLKHQIRKEHSSILPFNLLLFLVGKPRYAETWDFHVSASTFLQFEMSMGCSKPFSEAHSVQLQYSLNNGRDWHLVTAECVPPTIGCLHYTESSIYTSERFQNWKRITVYLPLSTK